jgi:hypothetical protein
MQNDDALIHTRKIVIQVKSITRDKEICCLTKQKYPANQ